MEFLKPDGSMIDLNQLVQEIMDLILKHPDDEYNLIIGTDSQVKKKKITYATAVILHRKGKGGKFYIHREVIKEKINLKKRLIKEVGMTIDIVGKLVDNGVEAIIPTDNIEVHMDIGHNGKSRDVITQCVGWCEGMGYNYKIKPEAYGAMAVADHCCRFKDVKTHAPHN